MAFPITSSYRANFYFRNKHLNTVHSHLFRNVRSVKYERTRIDTTDGDFLDLDLSSVGSRTIVIIVHGLEGSSNSMYVKGMVRAMNNAGRDSLAINLRSCSGEPNRLFSSYHSGRTDDIDSVIQYVESLGRYSKIMLVGFSLGGNIVLKYVGEKGAGISKNITAAVAISVPCDLQASSWHLDKISNTIYLKRLVGSLKKKALNKKKAFPEAPFSHKEIRQVRSFQNFDDLYTAPAHGFASAKDYYAKCSSKFFIPRIQTPTLLINALDDPFLTSECFPFEEAKNNPDFYLETPEHGGHVGFNRSIIPSQEFWHETRAVCFFRTIRN